MPVIYLRRPPRASADRRSALRRAASATACAGDLFARTCVDQREPTGPMRRAACAGDLVSGSRGRLPPLTPATSAIGYSRCELRLSVTYLRGPATCSEEGSQCVPVIYSCGQVRAAAEVGSECQ